MPVITTAIIECTLKWAVGRSIDFSAKQLAARLKKREATNELAEIINRAIECAIVVAPSVSDDFRSEAFLNNVLAPLVLNFLADPTTGLSEEDLSEKYIEIFVNPFLRGRSHDDTLAKVFLTDRKTLRDAFSSFLQHLRSSLYATEHWRDPIRDETLEEVRSTVLRIEKHLSSKSSSDKAIDLDIARADAVAGSDALRSWVKTIGGEYIERPELYQLQQRIRENPFASTLVIGEAGSGKSALFAELTARLEEQGMVVFAIKADLLPPEVRTLEDVSTALGLRGHLLREIEALSRVAPVVVLIDQLDAVSEVMDRSSHRMRLLLQVANHFLGKKRAEDSAPPVHVLVSSRQFEADYDARFRSLDAETIQLSLPSIAQMQELLLKLDITAEEVPAALHEILRRPFALRLFVDILRRGGSGKNLIASDLLNAWLVTANLGDSSQRRHTLEFLEGLASDMTESESLWRPADKYEIETPDAVSAAIACGIIMKQRAAIGFSHQAWLDDFQSKNFSSGEKLAAYAWERQDGLFARPTILRGLQRLRAVDENAYVAAINSLLGADNTRRHLRHLVVDLISGQHAPIACEVGWIQKIIRNDLALARRSLARAITYWPHWRSHLRSLLPQVMRNADLKWSVIQILIAESIFDSEFVLNSVSKHWDSAEHDFEVLQLFSKASLWSPLVVDRLQLIFQRQEYDNYVIAEYMKKLGDDRGAKLLSLYLDQLDYKKEERLSFHELHKLTECSRLAFTDVLLSWFVRIASMEADRCGGMRDTYCRSSSLPFSWSDRRFEDGIFAATQSTVIACATEQPTEFLKLCTQLLPIEVDEVQALIAEGLAAAGVSLINESVEFILSDTRRLQLGTDTVDDIHNVLHVVQGWSTQLLLKAIVPFANSTQLNQLKEYIERWNPYTDEAWATDDISLRLRRLRWAEELRFPLLETLPPNLLSSRRRRQIREWRATQPVLKKRRGGSMASWVQSPMSAAQMASASNDDVFNMLNAISDNTERWSRSRRRGLDGGSEEIGRAFGEFGKAHPDRALRIAEQFKPAHHEYAAGELLYALSEAQTYSQEILKLIHKWSDQGFSSDVWKGKATSALQNLAEKNCGLSDQDICLLESWIVNDPADTTKRIQQRIELEERNRQTNNNHHREVEAVVFGRGLGGIRVLPQDNFKLLSAMAAGFLCRAEPEWNSWLSALERHANRAEDPAIWTALLVFRGRFLYHADRERVGHLLNHIWKNFPGAFSTHDLAHFIWDYREIIPVEILKAVRNSWLSSDNPKNRQAAGELLTATVLVGGENSENINQLETILVGEQSLERLGILFAAAAAWREDDHELREKAHQILMRFIKQAANSEVVAISSAIDYRKTPNNDELTQEFLLKSTENTELLSKCLRRNFISTLQGLLLAPGLEESVLRISNQCADLMLTSGNHGQVTLGEKFVAIAVALQRSPEPIRTQAMDLYERLLDASAYGAEEAAEASLHRSLQH